MMTPASALTITAAASLKLVLGAEGTGAAPGGGSGWGLDGDRRGTGRQYLVRLVQDIFDVLFQRGPEPVVGSVAERGDGSVCTRRGADARAAACAARPGDAADLRRHADRPRHEPLHVDVVDLVDVQVGRV